MKHTVREATLANGAKGLVIHVPGVDVARMLVEFRAGYNLADWRKYELPHVMEHMMFTNETYPKPRQFSREVEKNGALNNASTSSTSLEYEYECAAFEAERIAQLIGIQISEPIFPEAEFKTELGNVSEELYGFISSPARMTGENLHAAMTGIPSCRQRIDQLESIGTEDLKSWYRKTHGGGNMRFIVAGDIDFDTRVLPYLDVELPAVDRLDTPDIPERSLQSPVVETRDAPQVYYLAVSSLSRPMPYRELIAARVIVNILSNGFSSTLLGEAREKGLAYSLNMGAPKTVHTTDWYLGGAVTPDHATEYFQLVRREIGKALDGKISSRQFEDTKQLMRGERARGYQKTANLVDYYDMFFNNELEEFDEYYRLLEEIGFKEAVAAFAALFEEKTWGISFVGNIEEETAGRYRSILSPLWGDSS